MNSTFTSEKGQGLFEYIILVTVIGLICLGTLKGLGKNLKALAQDMEKAVQKNSLSASQGY